MSSCRALSVQVRCVSLVCGFPPRCAVYDHRVRGAWLHLSWFGSYAHPWPKPCGYTDGGYGWPNPGHGLLYGTEMGLVSSKGELGVGRRGSLNYSKWPQQYLSCTCPSYGGILPFFPKEVRSRFPSLEWEQSCDSGQGDYVTTEARS